MKGKQRSFLWILHQMQLVLDVATFIPMASRRNCYKSETVEIKLMPETFMNLKESFLPTL